MWPVKILGFFTMQDLLYTGIVGDLTFQNTFLQFVSSSFYVSKKRKYITLVQQIDVLSKKQFYTLQHFKKAGEQLAF